MGTVVLYFALLVALTPLLGSWMYRVYTNERIGRIEGAVYRLCAIRPTVEQNWQRYASSVLWFSGFCFVVLYLVMRLQGVLPLNPRALPGVEPGVAFNTAVSFITNTNWQAYGGETTMSYLTDTVALTSQSFISAAVGMAVLVAFTRGFTQSDATRLGNFWKDLVRGVVYILLPLSTILAVLLISQGVVQTFGVPVEAQTGQGQVQTISRGPAASQVAIKQLGTNGAGFFNASSAHPFENPNPFSNFLQALAILLIPASLTYTFGLMVSSKRHGWAILAAMLLILAGGVAATVPSERGATAAMLAAGIDASAPNMEGKEARFGVDSSSLWATASTASSYGGVNSSHASFAPASGAVQIANMNMGVFGAVGGGVYSMVFYVIIAVLLGGLMVGRLPEYLGKRIGDREIKLAMIGIVVSFVFTLGLTGIAVVTSPGLEARLNFGAHGFTEILYAFTSQANNNGSSFAGLDASGAFYTVLGGIAMLFGRYVPMVAALAMAGGLAKSKEAPAETIGTLRTDTPLFVGLLVGVVLVLSVPFPALSLGPLLVGLEGVIP
ncbi:MAG: potassium-transporting ATPase subunit KdpA [Actinobacteria bacterium]|nr:potassium-transporting ATPase subunit KdpA [Actinomycetota bacterium]